MNRIDRLTAILIHLQTKRVVKAEEISDRFEISLRTVYRDVKALMEAGVPIGSEAGKGYFIVDGYHLPPVMFSQQEASAMLTAGKLVEKMTDASIRQAYESALLKIKAVLNNSEKDHLESLQSSIAVFRHVDPQMQSSNPYMAEVQKAIGQKLVMSLEYMSVKNQEKTKREVEPIGVVFYSGNWHMIAWCRLRNGYRDFRIDLIQSSKPTGTHFDSRNLLTLQEYFHSLEQAHRDMEKVVVSFDKQTAHYTKSSRFYYGFVSEEEKNDRCHMTFLTGSLRSFGKWLLMYGNSVEIESPDKLRDVMEEMVEELALHYKSMVAS
jgi:predicted DNA-binding transcriptional regulator YafY